MATAMAAEKKEAVQEETEMAAEPGESRGGRESFSEVRRKRKRKLKSVEMEVEGEALGTPAKRPSFPPVDASLAPVRHNVLPCGREREGEEGLCGGPK